AVRILHGQVPFRDFETLYSPGLVYLHAALFAATGGPSLLAMRALSLVARAALGLLLFVLARRVVGRPLWAAAPALLLLLGLDDAPVRWEPHPAWPSTAFAVAAVWCVTRADRNPSWLVGAGAVAAAAYAFKQNTGAFILAAVLLWCGRRQFLAPFLAFVVVTLAWLAPLVVVLDGQ